MEENQNPAAIPAGVLEAVKNRLNVTWSDTDTDNKYTGLIEDGIAYLDAKRGAPGDYTTPGAPRTLLFEYVRYARDEALDVFENNYRALILGMQNERAEERYGTTTAFSG